jgi:Spy/CpxP family protein refolding chaperone
MKKTILAAAVLLLCPALYSQQAATTPNWDGWKSPGGKWIGKNSSEQGQGSGYFILELDLQGRVLVRRNHSKYPIRFGSFRF